MVIIASLWHEETATVPQWHSNATIALFTSTDINRNVERRKLREGQLWPLPKRTTNTSARGARRARRARRSAPERTRKASLAARRAASTFSGSAREDGRALQCNCRPTRRWRQVPGPPFQVSSIGTEPKLCSLVSGGHPAGTSEQKDRLRPSPSRWTSVCCPHSLALTLNGRPQLSLKQADVAPKRAAPRPTTTTAGA